MTSIEKFEKTLDKKLREIKASFMQNWKNHFDKTNESLSFDWYRWAEDKFEWLKPPCPHPEHNPPNMICLRPGQILIHKCPACGKQSIIRGSGCYM